MNLLPVVDHFLLPTSHPRIALQCSEPHFQTQYFGLHIQLMYEVKTRRRRAALHVLVRPLVLQSGGDCPKRGVDRMGTGDRVPCRANTEIDLCFNYIGWSLNSV